MTRALAVFDVGKTNVKLTVLDAEGKVVAERQRPNTVLPGPPYPHVDVDALWRWLLSELSGFARELSIDAIVPITHGAAAALVDDIGLVLPILDYEHPLSPELEERYNTLRDPYALTYSPSLPFGLNLGRQLYWLETTFPSSFASAHRILLYPQYWAWRLSGVAATELTSLGCHTDLWQPARSIYSGLSARMRWEHLFPPLRWPWQSLGLLSPAIVAETGLSPQCEILCGIHDSNASLLRHRVSRPPEESFTVVSTGTWIIAAAVGASLQNLDSRRDMLANVDAFGQPVPCARFMGGREFAALNNLRADACSDADVVRIIEQGVFALPSFADAGGPFSDQRGRIIGTVPDSPTARNALASVYCALMTDHCLTALDARGDLIIEGSFTANPHYASVLAALRPQQRVWLSDDTAGSVGGGFVLANARVAATATCTAVAPFRESDVAVYRNEWITRCTP